MSGALRLILLLCASVVRGYSNGKGVACDTQLANLGSSEFVEDKTKVMWWVQPPRHNANYTLRTADGGQKADDPTTYVPGEWIDVHIRALTLGSKYRGLLLYAVDGQEQKVGEWSIHRDALFWLPDVAGCDGKAVLHASASPAHYHETFRFRAPLGQTGPLTFRALLKYGEAFPSDEGRFYYPNDKPLVLQPAADPVASPPAWVKGLVGQSCHAACQAQKMSCDPSSFASVASAANLSEAVGSTCLCPAPVMIARCDSKIAPTAGTEGCWFLPREGCPEDTVDDHCADASFRPEDGRRVCPCVETGVSFASPNALPSRLGAVMSMALLMGFAQSSSAPALPAVGLIGGFLALPGADAHNYMTSPARSQGVASFGTGCPPRRTPYPTIQVAAGQKFYVEHATGHVDQHQYYIVVKAEHETSGLTQHDATALDQYLEEAPDLDYMKDYNQTYHAYQTNAAQPPDGMFRGPAVDIPRPIGAFPALRELERDVGLNIPFPVNPNHNRELFINKEHDDPEYRQKRAKYTNSNWPWIMAVHRIGVLPLILPNGGGRYKFDPADTEMVWMEIPPDAPPGQYIIQWFFAGYVDCMDVNVLTNTVVDIYGQKSNTSIYHKVDHCLFFKRDFRGTVVELEPGGRAVFDANHANRDDPYWTEERDALEMCKNYCEMDNLNRDSACNALQGRSEEYTSNQTHFLCFPIKARDTKRVTGPNYETSNDIEDITFYSTCYLRIQEVVFTDVCPACAAFEEPNPPFRFRDHCIECAEYKRNQNKSIIPIWEPIEQCYHCDDSTLGG